MADCSQINNTCTKGTSAVSYDSTPLPCTDVNTCDGLNTILSKFDAIICDVKANVDILTEEIIDITEDLMIITEDVINIQNQLEICCPNCDFTGTADQLLDCNFTGTASQFLDCSFTGVANQLPVPTTTTTSSSTSTSTTSTSTSTSTSTTTSTSSSTTTTTTTSIVGECYTLTYLAEDPPPSTLYVRYTNLLDVVLTEEVTSLPTQDNQDGSYTVAICIKPGVVPICVFDDGINPPVDVTCNPYSWILGGSCTSPFGCLTPPSTTTTTTIACAQYTVGTTSGTGQTFTYTDCEGLPQSGTIGGASGFDSQTFCAQLDSVIGTAETTTTFDGPCTP